MDKSQPYRRTAYAVWELTLKCNLSCCHCGSRAGRPRYQELSTAEALDLVQQLADLGIGEVTLIGGEAFLRSDWLVITQAIVQAGMRCSLTTGGYGLSRPMAQAMKAAGMTSASVSLDGLQATHDRLRGRAGSWQAALDAMTHFRRVGLPFSCNSQINRLSAPELPILYDILKQAGIFAWQIQLTVPMGYGADHWHLLLQPWELLDLYPMLAHIAHQASLDKIRLFPGNNIGYYGPYERLLRGGGDWNFWRGCGAGLNTLGIEADGTIKGCPSLPTQAYAGGNIRDRPLREIIAQSPRLQFNRQADIAAGTEHLWGFCQTCEFAQLCRGGCSWTAHVFFGRRGNNPYCHHRALTLAQQGLRERFFLQDSAPGLPFDHGRFQLVQESQDQPWPAEDSLHFQRDRIKWPSHGPGSLGHRLPPTRLSHHESS
ncbi:radical SAM/SPASM domain-containing protein [Lyngbya confervoides]|uniref:Radical SAM protein n=1 Tax=Lyngbya confervoides BDU141951 TaxID=1574623 RepID=A0ABD4T6J1_9CYAN|nr:radical SAM protein [Lyngbya confervoides]MCM1984073.1 radical SAM protein [Lyngbya confervoides BDU141951]